MTVLIGHGYIGTAIAAALDAQNIPYSHGHHEHWQAAPGELIINAAGYTGTPNIDACEIHRRETIEGNLLWPLSLTSHPTLHISSGCIYEGDNGGIGWSETDKPNFDKSFYSLTKLIAEEQLSRHLENAWILRIRLPFGPLANARNLITKLINYPKLINVNNSMSNIDDVAKVVAWFVKNRPRTGIYNVTNPGIITPCEIIDGLGLKKEWFTPEEFAAACKASRSNCILNVKKLMALYPLRDVRDAMAQSIRDYRV